MSRAGPLVEVLADTREARAVRVYGLVRDPEDGRHHEVVNYASSAAGTPGRLARTLRPLADQLEAARDE